MSGVTITGPNSATAIVYPFSQYYVDPGLYSSVITVTACTTNSACTSGVIGSPQTINVSSTITGIKSSVANLAYSLGDNFTPNDLERTFSVTGYPSQAWTASSDVPWLAVTPTGGNAGAAVTVTASLISAQFEPLTSGIYTGTLILTPTSGDSVAIPVTLSVNRARVNFVAPYVALANISDDVIIRGENLLRYPTTGVRFGNADALAFTVVSDTEIRATHPALAAGTYPIHLINAQGFDRSRASLEVVNPQTYTATALAYPLALVTTPLCMQYDAERRSLLVGMLFNSNGTGSSRLVRYSMASGWTATANVAIPNLGACAFTTDGQQVLAGSLASSNASYTLAVSAFDPITLTQQLTTFDPRQLTLETRSMAVANNGRAIFTTSLGSGFSPIKSYSQLRPEIQDFRPVFYTLNSYDGIVGASGDGSVLLIGDSNSPGSQYLRRYDSSTNQIADTSLQFMPNGIAMNRTGSRLILTRWDGLVGSLIPQVYDNNFTLLGTLPATTTRAVVLSPTALRAYTFDSNGTIRTFDVSSASAGGSFTEILPAISPVSSPGSSTIYNMVITPDGRALFIAGSSQILLVPLQ